MKNPELKELAEKICELTRYGGQLHPNDILPELEASFSLGEQSGIKKAVDKMKIEGEWGKLTPFQLTVNTYIENRGKEILSTLNNQK